MPPEQGYHAASWRDIRGLIERANLEPDVRDSAHRSSRGWPRPRHRSMASRSTMSTSTRSARSTRSSISSARWSDSGCSASSASIADRSGSAVARSRRAHGQLPVPAPATAWLLADSDAPIAASLPGETGAGELLTPTGAAILGTLAGFERPTMTVQSVGTGFGSKELPWANICRVMIGETESASSERRSAHRARDQHRRHEPAVRRDSGRAALRRGRARCLDDRDRHEEGTPGDHGQRARPAELPSTS